MHNEEIEGIEVRVRKDNCMGRSKEGQRTRMRSKSLARRRRTDGAMIFAAAGVLETDYLYC